MQDDKTLAIINQIREEAQTELRSQIEDLQSQIDALLQRNKELEQQLEPLKKFEPILVMKVEERLIATLKLTEAEQEYLWAMAMQWYPKLSQAWADGKKGRNPVYQMLTDIVKWLVDGGEHNAMTELERLIINKAFPIHDA